MEMAYCPGCASDLHDATGACPVCGVPRAAPGARAAQRNPFKLIALCVLYAVALWFASMFAVDVVFGAADGAGTGQPERMFSGSLLLASIALSIALTACGKLPGTAKAAALEP
jgi:hypothetical protein